MRAIGLDIHRGFCEVAIAEDGRVRPARRVGTTPAELEAFAASLRPDDAVTLEATGNVMAIARILAPHARVVLANPKAAKAATRLRAKTDRIDARTLAQLLASGFLPEVWQPDETTASRTAGPLRAFTQRVAARRGWNVAIVAAARKLAVLAWHLLSREEEYAYGRPSRQRANLRVLELRTGAKLQQGRSIGLTSSDAERRLEREGGARRSRIPAVGR